MTRTLNLLAPKGPYTFGALVSDSLTRAGIKVNWWDYRKEQNPYQRLDPNAPNLVLRGEAKIPLAHVLDKMQGPRILWYAEDPARDQGTELLELCCYYENIWIHWRNQGVLDAIGRLFSNKTLRIVPVLYANQDIWKPMDQPLWKPEGDPDNGHAYACEVLHFGSLTPRREAILAELRRREFGDGKRLHIWQVEDSDHARLAKLVSRAKVVLNLHAWSDVNLEIRLAEAMSCGAFVISESLPDDVSREITKHHASQVASGSLTGLFDCCRLITQDWHYVMKENRWADIARYARRNFSHLKIADDIGPLIWADWDLPAQGGGSVTFEELAGNSLGEQMAQVWPGVMPN